MRESREADLAKLANRAMQLADKGEVSSVALLDDLIIRLRQFSESPRNSLALAQALFYRGRTYSSLTAVLDLDRAAADLGRAKRLFALFSDVPHQVECLGQLGVVEAQRYEREVRAGGPPGRDSKAYREAERLWKACLDMAEDSSIRSKTLANLARLYLIGTEWPLALDAYSSLLSYYESHGEIRSSVEARFGLAMSLEGLGRRRKARCVAEEAVQLSGAIGADGERIGQAAARLVKRLS